METMEAKGTYCVTFVAEYFSLTTNHFAYTEQDATDKAVTFIKDHYGWDILDVTMDIDIEFLG